MTDMSTPGSIALSTILDALEGVLSEPERAALMSKLVGLRPDGVAPGDLITAELMNQILSDINDLKIRVAALEGDTGGPVIERIEPQGVDKAIGSLISVIGRNLKPNDISTSVAIGAITLTDFFPDSTDTQINMPVPVGFATLPATVPVQVTTGGKVSNAMSIRVVAKPVIPTGQVLVRSQGAALPAIVIGTNYALSWRIISQVNVPVSLTLVSAVTAVSGGTATAQDWLNNIALSEAGPFDLQPGQSRDITMTVTVPAGADEADIGLNAESTVGGFEGEATAIPFKVGAAPDISDPRVAVAMSTMVATPEVRQGNIVIDGQTVQGFKIQPSKTVDVSMDVSTKAGGGGFFIFETAIEPAAGQEGRWTLAAMSGTRLQIPENQTQPVTVTVTSSALADTTTVSWLVVRAICFDAQSGGTAKFTSFTRVPVVGKS